MTLLKISRVYALTPTLMYLLVQLLHPMQSVCSDGSLILLQRLCLEADFFHSLYLAANISC